MVDELIYLLRIVFAVVLGFAIGFERKLRFKEAGIRTHTIVSGGSALIMIVSKYAFSDTVEFDSSRPNRFGDRIPWSGHHHLSKTGRSRTDDRGRGLGDFGRGHGSRRRTVYRRRRSDGDPHRHSMYSAPAL